MALSFETCTFPQKWKRAKVIPVPKKPKPTVDDLRPISLLPIVSKIVERTALDSIKHELIAMYGTNQFGFRPQYGTIHAHIKIHDYITRVLDFKPVKAVVIISYDMRKAFDGICHEHLIASLKKGNLPSKFLL